MCSQEVLLGLQVILRLCLQVVFLLHFLPFLDWPQYGQQPHALHGIGTGAAGDVCVCEPLSGSSGVLVWQVSFICCTSNTFLDCQAFIGRLRLDVEEETAEAKVNSDDTVAFLLLSPV